jgi:hypothetical protein
VCFTLYGEELNLNLRVHVLLTEGGLTKLGEWVSVSFLEYGALRCIWQYHLLLMVKRVLLRSLENSRLVGRLFREHKDGFYVYAKCRVSESRRIAGYVGRYLRLSAVAESRLSVFNVETNVVIYWYVDEGKVKQFVTFHVFEFIDCLVRFISDKNLKLIWYYGLYSRCTSGKLQKVLTPLSCEKVSVVRKQVVVCCSNCGKVMGLAGVTRPDDGGGGLVYVEGDVDDYAGW